MNHRKQGVSLTDFTRFVQAQCDFVCDRRGFARITVTEADVAAAYEGGASVDATADSLF